MQALLPFREYFPFDFNSTISALLNATLLNTSLSLLALTDILKSVQGIGRSSTRANIIETIIRSGFVQREKNQLIATDKAHKLMSILPPILTSAKMTAEWEEKLDKIERGELSSTQFMNERHNMAHGHQLIHTKYFPKNFHSISL